MFAQTRDPLDSVHATAPVETDDCLLSLARFGDRTAIVELWNRYYTTAYVAALGHATRRRTPAMIVTAGFQQWLERAKQHRAPGGAVPDWSESFGAEHLDLLHRAVSWAFYAMDEKNRAIVWRRNVDRWTEDELNQLLAPPASTQTTDGDPSPENISRAIKQAGAQFSAYLSKTVESFGLGANVEALDSDQLRNLLVASLLHSSTANMDEGTRIDSAIVIAPPAPPEPRFAVIVEEAQVRAVLRVVFVVVAAIILATIGVWGLTKWTRDPGDAPVDVVPTVVLPSLRPVPTPTVPQEPQVAPPSLPASEPPVEPSPDSGDGAEPAAQQDETDA